MADRGADGHHYQPGFGNEFVSEAVPGALPAGRNSPQQAPLGLYAEQLSGTAFTQPRAVSRRTWVYRIMPSAAHPRFDRIGNGSLRSAPFDEIEPDPNRLRWDPLPLPADPVDFVDGLYTVGGNGDLRTRTGMAVHLYAATSPMTTAISWTRTGNCCSCRSRAPWSCTPNSARCSWAPVRSPSSRAGSGSGWTCPPARPGLPVRELRCAFHLA